MDRLLEPEADGPRCPFHSLDEARRADWIDRFQRKGAETTRAKLALEAVPPLPTTVAEVREFAAWAMRAVARGQLSTAAAREVRELATLYFQADAIDLRKRAKEARDAVA
jgi:hypothetical protein